MVTAKLRAVPPNPSQDRAPSGSGAPHLLPESAVSHPATGASGRTFASPYLNKDEMIVLGAEAQSRCVTLFSWLEAGTITLEQFHRELAKLEQDRPPCDSCRVRGADYNFEGWKLCSSCKSVGDDA